MRENPIFENKGDFMWLVVIGNVIG